MAPETILSENQQIILKLISSNSYIKDNFYLGGGTALADFYLKHRFSEDLDFFSEKIEVESRGVFSFLKTIQKIIDYTGEIIWDTPKPDSTPRKLLDV